jgi:hypothetical protein
MSPRTFLVALARRSAETWRACGAFRGEATVETANTVYRFHDGGFVSRARKPERAFEAPRAMRRLVLIGFLGDEDGLRSFSPRFRPGAHAVLWDPSGAAEEAFILTSEVVDFAIETPPVVSRSSPDSMTRVVSAAR